MPGLPGGSGIGTGGVNDGPGVGFGGAYGCGAGGMYGDGPGIGMECIGACIGGPCIGGGIMPMSLAMKPSGSKPPGPGPKQGAGHAHGGGPIIIGIWPLATPHGDGQQPSHTRLPQQIGVNALYGRQVIWVV